MQEHFVLGLEPVAMGEHCVHPGIVSANKNEFVPKLKSQSFLLLQRPIFWQVSTFVYVLTDFFAGLDKGSVVFSENDLPHTGGVINDFEKDSNYATQSTKYQWNDYGFPILLSLNEKPSPRGRHFVVWNHEERCEGDRSGSHPRQNVVVEKREFVHGAARAAAICRRAAALGYAVCYNSAMPIEQIVQQLRAERDRLETAIKALTGVGAVNPARPSGGRKKIMSAEARRRISIAQKARWATRASTDRGGVARPTRTMSAAARRKIAAAQRARWAKLKARKS